MMFAINIQQQGNLQDVFGVNLGHFLTFTSYCLCCQNNKPWRAKTHSSPLAWTTYTHIWTCRTGELRINAVSGQASGESFIFKTTAAETSHTGEYKHCCMLAMLCRMGLCKCCTVIFCVIDRFYLEHSKLNALSILSHATAAIKRQCGYCAVTSF